MDKKVIGGLVMVAILGVALGVLGGFYLDEDLIPDYTGYVTEEAYNELSANLTLVEEDLVLAEEELAYYVDSYSIAERENEVYDILVDWANGEFMDDLEYDLIDAAYLNLSDTDDLNDYEFELDLERVKYVSFTEDEGEYDVVIEGELEWMNKDSGDKGSFDIEIYGQVEIDDDLDDEEIVLL